MRFSLRAQPPASPLPLTAATREALQQEIQVGDKKVALFDRLKCVHCGGIHSHACPRVKRMRFRPAFDKDHLVEVEFWPDGQWDDSHIVFPWHVYADGVAPATEEPPTPQLPSAGSET